MSATETEHEHDELDEQAQEEEAEEAPSSEEEVEVHAERERPSFFRDNEEAQRSDEHRRGISKIAGEAGKVLRSLMDRNPVTTESAEHMLDLLFRLLNRREFLERLLRSEFMKNVRDMQSEITETIGFASQADVQELKEQLDEVLVRLDKLQRTLDEIVVEVEES